MPTWYRDPKSGRLIKTNSGTVASSSKSHKSITMAENESVHDEQEIHPVRTMRDLLHAPRNSSPSCIIFPLNANNFRFKPGMISLLPNFHGLESESPYLHLKEFEEVCATFNDQNVDHNVVKLKLFPFSLKDKAKTWLNSLRPRSIGTWQEMQGEFLKKFFPTHKTNALKRQIQIFFQNSNEAYFQCWERFKDLLNSCPHHGFEKWRTISFFYEGLTPETKQFLETMCNGEFLDKEPEEAYEYLDHLAENSQAWHSTNSSENSIRSNLAIANKGKYQLSQEDDLNARFASLARKVEAMELGKVKEIKSVQDEEICGICDDLGHSTNNCPKIPVFKEVVHEQVNAMNNFKKPFTSSFSDTYNPGWRNHPNFSWRNDNNAHVVPPQGTSNFPPYASSRSRNLEETLQSFIQSQTNINNQTSQAINEIKNTLSTLTTTLHTQEKGKFPAQPQPNPAGQYLVSTSNENNPEKVNSITTLRSGKVIDKTIPSNDSKGSAPQEQNGNGKNDDSQPQKWEDSSFDDYELRIQQQVSAFNQAFGAQNSNSCNMNNQNDPQDKQMSEACQPSETQGWDPRAMLNNLSFLEKKIHQLQDLVHLIVGRRGQATGRTDEILVQQQQLITTDLTSIIVQLISTAGSLLPSVKSSLCSESSTSQLGQFGGVSNQLTGVSDSIVLPNNNNMNKVENHSNVTGFLGSEQNCPIEDHEMKSDDDADEGENLPPGSYEILQLEKEEILAPHTHFCTICGKGFKRDANLRMHMRGHGDEYKTPAALAKPNKEPSSEPILIKRYSCPFVGCKRNKDHKKFQPLKTILCVKNHYKRTHCDKTYTCSRCNTKKFSVIADLKTHEKHCGRDKWLCSCGTTFSRKDKLFGHIALFQGHTPAIAVEDSKGPVGPSDQGQCSEASKIEQLEFKCKSSQNIMDVEGSSTDDPISYFLPLGYDTSSISGFSEFPRPPFEDSESSFSFLLSGSCNYPPKNGGYAGSNNLE